MVLGGAAAALLFNRLGRMAGVPVSVLLSVGAGGVALAWLVRRIEATLDGISDHHELLTGIRALVRMIKTDPA